MADTRGRSLQFSGVLIGAIIGVLGTLLGTLLSGFTQIQIENRRIALEERRYVRSVRQNTYFDVYKQLLHFRDGLDEFIALTHNRGRPLSDEAKKDAADSARRVFLNLRRLNQDLVDFELVASDRALNAVHELRGRMNQLLEINLRNLGTNRKPTLESLSKRVFEAENELLAVIRLELEIPF